MFHLFTDGGSRGNPGQSACAYFLFEDDKLIDFNGKYLEMNTNNNAEYNGLILGLKAVQKLGITEIQCNLDSELVVKQLNGEYKISHDDMKKLATQVKTLAESFSSIKFVHVLRANNKFADKLVNTILDTVGK